MKLGSSPARIRMIAIKLVVVVLPWLPADADAVLPLQQRAEKVEALHHWDASRSRGCHFWVIIWHSRGNKHEIGADDMLALVPTEDRCAVARQLVGGVVGPLIGAGHAEAHL